MKTAKVFCPPGTLLGLFVWTWELEPRGLKREFGMGVVRTSRRRQESQRLRL